MIGAQVGYPDLAGFGRRFIDMSPDDLTAAVIYQIGALDGLARAGRRPGPLREAARRALQRRRRPRGPGHGGRRGGARVRPRAAAARPARFGPAADRRRARACDRSPSTSSTATTPPTAGWSTGGSRTRCSTTRRRPPSAPSGAAQQGRAESMCTHGDSPGAVEMARTVRAALDVAGIDIAPFVESRAMTRRLLDYGASAVLLECADLAEALEPAAVDQGADRAGHRDRARRPDPAAPAQRAADPGRPQDAADPARASRRERSDQEPVGDRGRLRRRRSGGGVPASPG